VTVSEALTSTYVQSGFSFEVSHTHRLEGSESLRGPLKASEGIEESVIKVEMLSPEDAKKARKKAKNAAYGAAYRAANKEKIAAKDAAYYEANKEEIAAYNAAWYAANKEKIAAKGAAYYEGNKEKIAAKGAAYYEANKEEIAAKNAAYRAANKEKVAAQDAACRAEARERRRSETEEQRLASVSAALEYITNNIEVAQGGCWEWQKYSTGGGYGQAYWDGLGWAAHRLSYHYIVARIPDGAAIHHKCSNRACCNPDHLQATTQQDNTAEMMGRRFLEDEIGRLNLENDYLRQAIEDLHSEVDYLVSKEDI
jgi:hypothetical protein